MIGRAVQLFVAVGALLCSALCSVGWAQIALPGSAVASSQPAPPPDALGRETPRGAVLGFLSAARKGDFETARRFLDTPFRDPNANTLARQLSVVLDRRLPARLNALSPRPEGSLYYPDRPDLDLVGAIEGPDGVVDIVVQRMDRGKSGTIWLFSKGTLNVIPALYEEVNRVSVEETLPAFLTKHKRRIPLLEWLAALVGLPLVYFLTGVLDRLVSPLVNRLSRRFRKKQRLTEFHLFPKPVRLLLLALIIRWGAANLQLPLLMRQLWTTAAIVITIAACVWLLLMLSKWGENLGRLRLARRGVQGSVAVLRLVRWTFNLLALFGGMLALLSYFKLNVTAALAGLGVGGIAVALAAQKTLENVIGGISLIADRVVRVGDFLKIGATVGTVEDIGLRSTRIRTMDRSLVSIPNGQISNERLEDMSCRDKFWFHPMLSLQYGTTGAQMHAVLDSIRTLLLQHTHVELDSVRVRFLSFGTSSLDVDISAYVAVIDYACFLEVQEELLLQIMNAVQAAGTRMALPSQTTYVTSASADKEAEVPEMLKMAVRS